MTVPFFYWVVLSSVEIPVSFCWGTASKQLSASYEPDDRTHISGVGIPKRDALWDRGYTPCGIERLAASVVPESTLMKRATAALTWFFPVMLTTGAAASFAGTAGWLLHRRVLGFAHSPRPAASATAIMSMEGPEPPDFVKEVLAGEAVEENSKRLFRALAAHRFGALALAIALLGAAWYILRKVPAAWRGEYESAMSLFHTWEMVLGAAEAVVFLLLPLIVVIAIVVALFTGGEELGSMFGVLAFLVVVAVIAYCTGFIDPLLELIEKLR